VRLIAWDHISKMDGTKGFLFDGYPRGLEQYEHLKDMLMKFGKKIDRVIYITISEQEVIRRLSARRVCQKCGRIYNLITNPSPAGEKCKCGGELEQRADDKPEAIKKRLAWGWTKDVKEKAREEGILLEINGERPIEEIQEDIIKELGL
jgi:adenylate kinase